MLAPDLTLEPHLQERVVLRERHQPLVPLLLRRLLLRLLMGVPAEAGAQRPLQRMLLHRLVQPPHGVAQGPHLGNLFGTNVEAAHLRQPPLVDVPVLAVLLMRRVPPRLLPHLPILVVQLRPRLLMVTGMHRVTHLPKLRLLKSDVLTLLVTDLPRVLLGPLVLAVAARVPAPRPQLPRGQLPKLVVHVLLPRLGVPVTFLLPPLGVRFPPLAQPVLQERMPHRRPASPQQRAPQQQFRPLKEPRESVPLALTRARQQLSLPRQRVQWVRVLLDQPRPPLDPPGQPFDHPRVVLGNPRQPLSAPRPLVARPRQKLGPLGQLFASTRDPPDQLRIRHQPPP